MRESYLITGASGYVGSMLIKQLLSTGKELQIVAMVRDEKKLSKDVASKVEIIVGDIASPDVFSDLNGRIDYIIHTAAPTASKYMVTHPVETADAIAFGTRNVLELARRLNVKSVVVLSSMEVYGIVSDMGIPRSEEELGNIDIASLRSCYPLAKRLAEHYCYSYCQEYGVPVKVARLAQTFGKGVRKEDHRVYMQFACAAVYGEDIHLNTDGLSIGNYCAIDDVGKAVFLLLEKGKNGETYNVVNEKNTMTIYEMAKLVANEIAGGKIRVCTRGEDPSKHGYPPDTGLRLSSKKLCALGWKAEVSLEQMYKDVIHEMKLWEHDNFE